MLKDLLKACRSYRGYDESYHFTEEELMELVDHTRYAASSMNIQPLKFYLAWEKEEVDRIQPLTGWAKQMPEMELPHKGMCPTAFIIICQDLSVDDRLARFHRDVGIVAQTILLAAAEKGLGGCMIGSYGAKPVKECLHLPENLMPMLIVALGKPAEKIVLTEIEDGEDFKYYRDENDVHYVPKRKLKDIVVTEETIR